MPLCTVPTVLDRVPSRALERLIQGGVAPRQARRILREFAEHHADLVAEQLSFGAGAEQARAAAAARLGSEEQLIAGTLARPELRSWLRRRPCAAFALAPLLAFAITFVGSIGVLIGFFEWLKSRGASLSASSPMIHWLTAGASVYLLWALPAAIAAAIALLAIGRREITNWPMVGMIVTCFAGALTNFSFDLPPLAAAPGMTAGIGLGSENIASAMLRAGSTAALTALPYLWARYWRRSDPDTLS
jgi:hypothetical protein